MLLYSTCFVKLRLKCFLSLSTCTTVAIFCALCGSCYATSILVYSFTLKFVKVFLKDFKTWLMLVIQGNDHMRCILFICGNFMLTFIQKSNEIWYFYASTCLHRKVCALHRALCALCKCNNAPCGMWNSPWTMQFVHFTLCTSLLV